MHVGLRMQMGYKLLNIKTMAIKMPLFFWQCAELCIFVCWCLCGPSFQKINILLKLWQMKCFWLWLKAKKKKKIRKKPTQKIDDMKWVMCQWLSGLHKHIEGKALLRCFPMKKFFHMIYSEFCVYIFCFTPINFLL